MGTGLPRRNPSQGGPSNQGRLGTTQSVAQLALGWPFGILHVYMYTYIYIYIFIYMVPPPMYLPFLLTWLIFFVSTVSIFGILLTRTTREEWLAARNSSITLVLPMFFQGWSPKTSVKPVLSIKPMVFNPCGWEHPIHG